MSVGRGTFARKVLHRREGRALLNAPEDVCGAWAVVRFVVGWTEECSFVRMIVRRSLSGRVVVSVSARARAHEVPLGC